MSHRITCVIMIALLATVYSPYTAAKDCGPAQVTPQEAGTGCCENDNPCKGWYAKWDINTCENPDCVPCCGDPDGAGCYISRVTGIIRQCEVGLWGTGCTPGFSSCDITDWAWVYGTVVDRCCLRP